MEEDNSYFTIISPSEGIVKDRGSKFMAYAFPVSNEDEIKQFLQHVKSEHPSARHHCYAWRLGADKKLFRANDDGEPSGSAGKPILSQIQANNLSDILIVVVRYFGGTLLGVNGLINAYQNAATEAIKNARLEERFALSEYKIEFSFEDMRLVMKILKDHDAKIISRGYTETNDIIFQIKKQSSEKLKEQLSSLYKVKLTSL